MVVKVGRKGILYHFKNWAKFTKGQPEDLLCYEIVSNIRALILAGEFRGIFFHVENETGGRRTALYNMIKKVTGKIPGAPDYVFMREGCGIMIEIKCPGEYLSKPQKEFHKWCAEYGVPVYVCRSWAEVKQILIDNNFIC